MAGLKEAFLDLDAQQSQFYQEQQAKYQELEPNRLLPDVMKGNIGADIVSPAVKTLSDYDPYTGVTKARFSATGLQQILQGQPPVTPKEDECRSYTGLQGLNKLIQDTANDPLAPVRCGWRYKPPVSGSVAAVAQGALGTRNGPLNNNAPEDKLENGVRWIWNLTEAKKIMMNDIAKYFATAESLGLLNNVQNGALRNQIGWCTTTQRMIPLNDRGLPAYPNDATLNCPPSGIVTDPAKLPPASGTTNSIQLAAAAKLEALTSCVEAGNRSSPLSRDCLLLAIKNNGCSDEGALYQSIQLANPNSQRWDTFLSTQPSFLTYQSRQGANAITEALFEKNRGTWQSAIDNVMRLNKAVMTATDPYVRVASQDLCSLSGKFDSYNFCDDLTDDANIASVELNCLQNYWQEQNGKPAGLAYPKDRNFNSILKTALGGEIATWGSYKKAVLLLKEMTSSTDAKQQRVAIGHFYGVQISGLPFTPKNVEEAAMNEGPPCLGLGKPSPDNGIRLYTQDECEKGMNGDWIPNGECLGSLGKGRGGSYSAQCAFLNGQGGSSLAMWLDATDGSTLIIDGKNRVRNWKDKSGKGRDILQESINARPTYSKAGGMPGIVFNGTSNMLPIPNGFSMVSANFTIFVVEKKNSMIPGANWFIIGNGAAADSNLVIGYRADDIIAFAYWANDLDTRVPGFRGALEIPRIWCFMQSANGRTIYLNGSLVGQDNNLRNLKGWAGAAFGGNLGAWYNGTIYETLFYTRSYNNLDRSKVEGYLAHKYGLAGNLPAGHPFKSGSP